MNEERLQKYLARMGVTSRRKAEDLIRAKQVTVNGKLATLGTKVLGTEDIVVEGLRINSSFEAKTFMLYKPVGVISTVRDPQKRPTVMQLVPKVKGLHPVGRLDADSEGLILLSNDGDLTLKMTHPRYGHKKEYQVWCTEGSVKQQALIALKQGVQLEDGMAKAVSIKATPFGCTLVLEEGRNRQIRRMLAAVGYNVERLKRTRINKLTLGKLEPGKYRELSQEDLTDLGYLKRYN